jgi:hypothetical protein
MSTNQQVVTGALCTQLVDSLRQIAATRKVLDRAGAPMPADVHQGISDIRRLMRDIGISEGVIDAIPGLELSIEEPPWCRLIELDELPAALRARLGVTE